jgi:signal transduction histidine kinase
VGGVVAFLDITPIKDLERQKDSFLAAVSHDLKNPLSAIKARAQFLQRRTEKLEGAEPVTQGLQAIDQAATRITGMINELLDVARLQAGKPLDLDRQPMDLVDLARQVVAEYQPSTERHEVRVASKAPMLLGQWDRARLERVVANLVANAIKYSPEGGPVQVEVGRERRGGGEWAVLRVRDRGVGIPAADLPRVFDRFYRGSNVQGRIEGTGIGLAGARQIVEQHGGEVLVESKELVGSTFTVRLPLEAPTNGATQPSRGGHGR